MAETANQSPIWLIPTANHLHIHHNTFVMRSEQLIVLEPEPNEDAAYISLPNRSIDELVARFRYIDADLNLPHGTLEFANGEIALVAFLAEGQTATEIQLPLSGVNEARDGLLGLAT